MEKYDGLDIAWLSVPTIRQTYQEIPMKFKAFCAALALSAVSLAQAGPILIINGLSTTSEVGTTTSVTNNLANLHTLAGNVVTIADGMPVSLAGYSQVWDVRFGTALDAAATAQYSAYLGAGGGLFLMGENSSFMPRNNSILSLISGLGGGSLGYNACFDGFEVVHAPFNGPNAVPNVNYAASGCFTGTGTGQWITSRADNSIGAGLAFNVGSLSNAMTGALTTILDVNFMMNSFDLPNSQQLTKNLITYVGGQVEPNDVPEPGMPALAGIAALAAFASRKRKVA
jgi:hypothetical protein